jgi:predicted nucleotidyltransferase
MADSVETITAGLEERAGVLGVLRRHERELCGRGLSRLALFGSTARGDPGPKRDVDLLIEVDPARVFGLFASWISRLISRRSLAVRSTSPSPTRCARGSARPCFGMRSRSSDGGSARKPAFTTIDNAVDPDRRRGTSLR